MFVLGGRSNRENQYSATLETGSRTLKWMIWNCIYSKTATEFPWALFGNKGIVAC
jgi:hypothetical protein